ncbi:hypothetical protein WJX74_002017 [Apatococcus lobatus]|uniref:Uncharacterized protein n=1 Tax=Apatococcus lobatus TaxID=904363 RepID=A0AAW1SA20_9CHLO
MVATLEKKRRPRPAGLSIQKFAKAKQTGYDKRQKTAVQQEQRARQKGKFRKLKARLGKEGWLKPVQDLPKSEDTEHVPSHIELPTSTTRRHLQAPAAAAPRQPEVGGLQAEQHAATEIQVSMPAADTEDVKHKEATGHRRKQKPASALQRIAASVQAQKEAESREREATRQAAAEHRARVAASHAQRKQRTQVLRKRTSSGQPVMKYRIEGMLSALEND